MSEEIKVVLTLKESGGFVGVQAPNCDPIFTPFEGAMEVFLGRIPELVQEARQRWEENPRYRKCESPLPSQTVPRLVGERSTPRQSQSAIQPRIFRELFSM